MLQQKEISKGVYAAFKDSPFALPSAITEVYVAAGSSIQEIIDKSVKEEWQKKYLRVILNDEVIQPDDYKLTFVKESDVVGMVLVPQGGDAGGILKAVAVIAIVIAVTIFAPEFLPATWSATTVAAVSAGVGAAAGLAASLALNALFPPPVPGVQSSSTSGTAEDPVYGFSRTGNQINRYAAIPRIYGCRKVFPQHAIAPYIIAKGTDQYLYQAFTAGYGLLKIEDIRIGDNPIGNYKDVEYFVHEGFVAGDELRIVKNDNWQDPYSIKLTHGVDSTVTTTDDAEEASLAIQFSQGLFQLNSQNGDRQTTSVVLDVQARQVGAATWNPITAYSATIDDAVLNSSVTSSTWNAIGDVYTGEAKYATVTELPESSSVPNAEFRTLAITQSDDYGNSIYSYQDYQNSYVVASSTSQIKVEKATARPFFVNVNLKFPAAGRYEIKVQRVTADRENESVNPHYDICTLSSLRSGKSVAPVATDKPISLIELKIRATDQLNGAVNNLSCKVTSKLPVWNGSAWSIQETRNPAWAYLDVMRGTAAKTVVPDSRIDLQTFKNWADWCDETQANFAFTPPSTPNTSTTSGYVTSLYYTILFRAPDTEGLNYWVGKIDSNQMTRAQVQAFFLQSQEASAINRAKCDLEITSQTTAWEVLKLIASTGYATPSQNGGKYSISIDQVKSTPVQMFTPKNIRSFSGNMTYHIQPHALRIAYTQTNETESDEIIVYDDGYNADGSGGKQQATVFESIKLVGITRYNQAYTMGRRALAQGRLRIEKFTISCDVENLLATRGSLVRLAHDVPKIGAGSGKVIGSSGSIITIDEDFKISAGNVYAHIRHSNGSQSSGTLSAISASSATLSGATASEGDLIVYGELNRVVTDCLVKSVRPGHDLTATLELVPYAPAIYTAETDAIPPYDPWGNNWTGGNGGGTNTGNKLTPGLVTSLLATYQVTYDNKTPRVTVDLSWGAPVTGGTVAKYKVWFQDTSGWRLLGETTELTYKAFNQYVFTDASGALINLNGKSLTFAVAGVGSDGSSLNPDYAKQVSITPIVGAPKEIAALYATPRYMAIEVSWTFTNDPFNTATVEIWGATSNSRSSASLIAKVDADLTSYVHSGLDPDSTWYYWIVAADGNGNYSEWYPATTNSSISAKPLTAKTQYIDISGFTGFNVNAGGLYTPTNATLTAIVTGVTSPTYSWTVSGATTGVTNASSLTVTPNGSDTKISVTLTVNGANVSSPLTKSIIMPITYNGAAGEAGANGMMSAFPTIYQWTASSTPPSRPSTTSTYTWGAATFTAPSGWYSYSPSNTSTGYYLWSITIPLSASATTATSTLDWTNTSNPIRCIAYNGTNGNNGTNGSNGAATFVITRSANDSSAPTTSEVSSAIGRSPVAGDICTVSYNSYNNAVVYRYTTSWTLFTTYITGSLIVQNTITADRLVSKTITAASGVIGDAAVNTLQIAGNAVTVPSYFQNSGEVFNISTTSTIVVQGTITTSGYQPIVVDFTSGIGGGSDNSNLNLWASDCNAWVYVDTTSGTTVAYKGVVSGVTIDPGLMRIVSGSCVFTTSEVPAGTYRFSVKVKCLQTPDGTNIKGLFARNPSFTVLETKR